VVLDDRGQEMQIRSEIRPRTHFEADIREIVDSPKDLPIGPGCEAKIALRFDAVYDLSTPGAYQAYFKLKLPAQERQLGRSDVTSGKVTFQVLPGSQPVGNIPDVYLPVDRNLYVGDDAAANAYAGQLEAAKHSSECRPAELDPEGHWGPVYSGYQLSLRFSNDICHVGEKIAAVVVLRNVTTNALVASAPDRSSIWFEARDGQGKSLGRKLAFTTPSSHEDFILPLHRQIAYTFDVQELYDLKSAGQYIVTAQRRVETDQGEVISEVSSAPATIKLLPAQDASESLR
jgi:hypothetical protein